MKPVAKTKDNPFFRSKYADLASIIEQISPILSKHGLSVAQLPTAEGLKTWLLHESGEWIAETAPLYLAKQDPQSHGSAITYGRRAAYQGVTGAAADDDDDGNAASRHERPAPKATPIQKRPEPQPIANEYPEAELTNDEYRKIARNLLANAVKHTSIGRDAANALWDEYTVEGHHEWLDRLELIVTNFEKAGEHPHQPQPATITALQQKAQEVAKRTRPSSEGS